MKKLFLITVSALMIGCNVMVHVYPVGGPLSKTPREITATVDGVYGGYSGVVHMTMPDGEFCKGHWSVVSSHGYSYDSEYKSMKLGDTWVQVYGKSSRVNIPASPIHGQAILTGSNGSIVEMEFLVGRGTVSGYGVAKDNKGNYFKLIF